MLAPHPHRRHVLWPPRCPAENSRHESELVRGTSQSTCSSQTGRACVPQVDQVCTESWLQGWTDLGSSSHGAPSHWASPVQQCDRHAQASCKDGLDQMPWCSTDRPHPGPQRAEQAPLLSPEESRPHRVEVLATYHIARAGVWWEGVGAGPSPGVHQNFLSKHLPHTRLEGIMRKVQSKVTRHLCFLG